MRITVSQLALAVGAFALVCSTAARADDAPSPAELQAQIKQLQKEIQSLSAKVKAVEAKKARAAAANPPASAARPGAAPPLPANAQVVDERSRAWPNVMVEPLWPSMDLINNPNTWLGVYGTIEADIGGSSNQDTAGHWRVGMDNVPWLSANRLGFAGAHEIQPGLDSIFRLEIEYDTPTGDMDTPGQLFNRDAWVGRNSADFGKLTLGRQNGLGRDATQFYLDPYGSASATLGEDGWMNQEDGRDDSQMMKNYVSTDTGSRVDSGVVWKKITGPWYTAAMYQFGASQNDYPNLINSCCGVNGGNYGPDGATSNYGNPNLGSAQAVALAYNFGVGNIGGFYQHANIGGYDNQVFSLGGNVLAIPTLRLNAGYVLYTADQETVGQRTDNVFTVSAKYAPEGHFDYELAYDVAFAHNGMEDPNGVILDPWSYATAEAGNVNPNTGLVQAANGVLQTLYGSVRYNFDQYSTVFVGFDYTVGSGAGYSHYAVDSGGYADPSNGVGQNSVLSIAAGYRYRF